MVKYICYLIKQGGGGGEDVADLLKWSRFTRKLPKKAEKLTGGGVKNCLRIDDVICERFL